MKPIIENRLTREQKWNVEAFIDLASGVPSRSDHNLAIKTMLFKIEFCTRSSVTPTIEPLRWQICYKNYHNPTSYAISRIRIIKANRSQLWYRKRKLSRCRYIIFKTAVLGGWIYIPSTCILYFTKTPLTIKLMCLSTVCDFHELRASSLDLAVYPPV